MGFTAARSLVQDVSLGISMGTTLQSFYDRLHRPQTLRGWQYLMTDHTIELSKLALASLHRLNMPPERFVKLSWKGAAVDLLVWHWLDGMIDAYIRETRSKRAETDEEINSPLPPANFPKRTYLHLIATVVMGLALSVLMCLGQRRVPAGFLASLLFAHLSSRLQSPNQHSRYLRVVNSKEQTVSGICLMLSVAEWFWSSYQQRPCELRC